MKHRLNGLRRPRQQGFTLMELAVAMVVMGILTLAALSFWRSSVQQRVSTVELDLLSRAQQAVLGFVYTQHRLPCPALDVDGVEVCSPNTNRVGRLPWKSLQLPDAAAGEFKYGVYRQPDANAWNDRDLAVRKDRMRPLMALGTLPAASEVLLGNLSLLDFCVAIQPTVNPTVALAVREAKVIPSAYRAMSFVIAAPGLLDADNDGDRFDGWNHSASSTFPYFEASNLGSSDTYDDRVVATSFGDLFTQMQCASALTGIGRMHFNAALTAALAKRALFDYHYQLEVSAVLAGAALAGAVAGASGAAAGLGNATATLINSIAFTTVSAGTAGGLIAAATAAVIANTAVVAVSGLKVAAALAATIVAAAKVAKAATMVTNTALLSDQIDINARNADALGH